MPGGLDLLWNDQASPVSTQTRDDSVDRRVGTVGRVGPAEIRWWIQKTTRRSVPLGVSAGFCTGFGDGRSAGMTRRDCGGDRRRRLDALEIWLRWTRPGTLRIAGRIKTLVVRGGEDISPRSGNSPHPIISDGHVIGVPAPNTAKSSLAVVKLADAPELTIERLRSTAGRIARIQDPARRSGSSTDPDDRHRQSTQVEMRQQALRIHSAAVRSLGAHRGAMVFSPQLMIIS